MVVDPAERFALALIRGGMQRMTARLLAVFLFTEQPTLTMGDLVEVLGVSSGSASTGIKALVRVGLVEQVPAPGSRRDHYRLRDDAWATLFSRNNEAVQVMLDASEDAIAATPRASAAHQRLMVMRSFYTFLLAEIPTLIQRWKQAQGQD
jgi:DNA-binding transcriptional regulator GbsR (MarR family)